ncbi:MAG: T9SS type A sorting domain-containing protein, partial [Candidatus Marinimicrobia bacterium]|nr:T9SS type A sorting domain-containing protein [Candidatus Neomarinimicrobiota bacterium]
ERGVKLAWDSGAESSFDPLVGAIDFEGYRIYRASFRPNDWELIAAFDKTDGPVYMLNFDTGDTLKNENGENIYVDLPDIANSYIDTGAVFYVKDESGANMALFAPEQPINNLPYYYVVTSFDNPYKFGATEFVPIECSKSNFMVDPSSGAPLPIFPRKVYTAKDPFPEELNVKVYPNPYRGSSILEVQYEDKISFTNLPPACKINIFTPAGDLVHSIWHSDGTSDVSWDLVSRNDQDIVSGLYLFTVETTNGKLQVGKFVVLRGQ